LTACLLTIVGGVRERSVVTRRGRGETVCARGAWWAPLGGPSTSPLELRVRLLLGTLIAPMAPVVLFSLIAMATGSGHLADAGPFLVVGVFYVYPAMLLFGLPLYFYAESKGPLTLTRTVLSGAAVGAFLATLVVLSFGTSRVNAAIAAGIFTATVLVTWGAAQGALSGLCFWLIVARSSNNRWRGP